MLSNYEYSRNNIELRIVSAEQLAKYKKMQHDNLYEMLHGKHPFPHKIREIFLLKLDVWFRYLLTIEKHLIHQHKKKFDEQLVIDCLKYANRTFDIYINVIRENPKEFDKSIYPIWIKIHIPLFEVLLKEIEEQLNNDTIVAFENISEKLIKILRSTLFELYEIDLLHNNKECCLVFDNMSKEMYNKDKTNLMLRRLKEYKNKYEINKVYIKNYSDYRIEEQILKEIDDIIKIDFYKSF